jgi:hypothetical protein
MFDDLAAPGFRGMIDAPPAGDLPSPRTYAATEATSETPSLNPADIDAIARRVVERLSDRVLREIAWDVVPDLADIIVRERIRELERDERESS